VIKDQRTDHMLHLLKHFQSLCLAKLYLLLITINILHFKQDKTKSVVSCNKKTTQGEGTLICFVHLLNTLQPYAKLHKLISENSALTG